MTAKKPAKPRRRRTPKEAPAKAAEQVVQNQHVHNANIMQVVNLSNLLCGGDMRQAAHVLTAAAIVAHRGAGMGNGDCIRAVLDLSPAAEQLFLTVAAEQQARIEAAEAAAKAAEGGEGEAPAEPEDKKEASDG